MRRDDPGREAGQTGGTQLAEAPGIERRFAGWQQPAGLRQGVLAEGILQTGVDLHHGTADQLAALVARVADAPAGLIHLVQDGRLRMYGAWGPDTPWDKIVDIALEQAFSEPVAIEKLGADEAVPGLSGGAYLGHPVRDRTGAVIGICAALDPRPREWSAAEVSAVAQAAQVATLLITEQMSRYEIDQQHRFLDAVLDSLHDGVTACDADGRIVFVNERMRMLWDASDDGLPDGLTDADGKPLGRDDLGLFRALRGEHLRDEEVILQGPVRPIRHFLVDAHPIVGPDGRTVGAVQAVQDVSRRRRVERFRMCELAVTTALAEEPTIEAAGPRVLEAVVGTLDWVHAELWLVDAAAGVVRPAARWSAPGRAADLAAPDDLPYGQGLPGRAWQVGKPLWIKDVGRPQSLISPETAAAAQLHGALAVPIREGFETLGVLTVFTDAIEEPEDELLALMSGIAAHIGQFVEKQLVEDLQRQLTRSKDEYLALVGHELRTPLTSISAYTELLREADEKSLVSDGPRMLEVIERNTNQLRNIINELMELSALDAGHADVQLLPMDLAEVVRDSLAKARAAIDGAPLVIDEDLPAELVLPGDRKRLRQVVDNLLGNAVKYSPDGGRIGVTLRRTGRAAELSVSDTGVGVTNDEREKMFTGLYRTSRKRDSAIPGTFVGLTLSRGGVGRQHGSIELVEHKGQGSTILLRLPMDPR
ncbi:MAG: ATP-binding protein [Actinoplanes sp.]